ncbi:MFS transporter [Amorphus sp. MBR-141]
MTATAHPADTSSDAGAPARWALLALAIGAFAIGTTEFSPMGLLPIIAEGVHVSIPQAGLLISAYAIGVMIGAPIMTIAFSRFGKRTALMLLMGIFTVGNVMSALAPDYGMLLLARLVTSLNHGAFFGLGSIVAAGLVAKEKRAGAVAAMFMGLTIANIGGVPAASWIGQQIGWRAAFAGTAVLGLVAISALAMALPKSRPGPRPELRREIGVLTRPNVLLAMATTVMGSAAMFTLYTYVAAALDALTGASGGFVTFALVLIGVGFTVGNWFGGRLSAWSLDGATAVFLAALATIMLGLPVLLVSHVGAAVGLLVWGAAAFAIVSPIQTRVMLAAEDAPALASSINVGAFNLGNAIGAAVGGAVIAAGLGYQMVPVAGAVLALLSLLLVWASRRSNRMLAARLPAAVGCR